MGANGIRVVVGPQNEAFGSWNWLGQGFVNQLGKPFSVMTFHDVDHPPHAEIVVYVKFRPSAQRLAEIATRSKIVFLPVDVYGSVFEIESDLDSLQNINLTLVHCRRLLRYFNVASDTCYLDHPLKFALNEPKSQLEDGPLFWVGKSCNLRPVAQWANTFGSKLDLWVLTDQVGKDPSRHGFAHPQCVRMANWTESLHFDWMRDARVAVDIKGDDFRSRHKPPAKGFDFIASGIPVLTTQASSLAIELRRRAIEPLTDLAQLTTLVTKDYLQQAASIVRSTAEPYIVWRKTGELLSLLVT